MYAHTILHKCGFRPRLRELILNQNEDIKMAEIGHRNVSVPDYGELILNYLSFWFCYSVRNAGFRPRLRGTNLKQQWVRTRKRFNIEGFRPRLRGTNLKQLLILTTLNGKNLVVSVPDYGELILNNKGVDMIILAILLFPSPITGN